MPARIHYAISGSLNRVKILLDVSTAVAALVHLTYALHVTA